MSDDMMSNEFVDDSTNSETTIWTTTPTCDQLPVTASVTGLTGLTTLSTEAVVSLSEQYIFSDDNTTSVVYEPESNILLEDGTYIIQPQNASKLIAENALTDPILQEILLNEGDNQSDFDPEAESLKLQKFLEGNMDDVTQGIEPILKMSTSELPSTGYRIVKCFNCFGLFDILSFQNHTCEYDANHQLIDGPALVEKKVPPPPKPITPPKKPDSERIILENQIRIRRYLKEELKYDLNSNTDDPGDKKNKGPNECTMCERKFVHASGLVRHMEKHALDLIPTTVHSQQGNCQMVHGLRLVIKCNDCGRLFYDTPLALNHVKKHYFQRVERVYSIELPEENYESLLVAAEETLSTHAQFMAIDYMSSLQEEKFNEIFKFTILSSVLQCEFCDYVFSDVSHLLVHSASHPSEIRYECTACGVSMNTMKDSSNHFQTECGFTRENLKQLQITVQRYFVCNVCENKFLTLDQLHDHRYSAYHYFPRLSQDKTLLMLPCECCDLMFVQAFEICAHYEEKHFNKKKRVKDTRNSNSNSSTRLRQYLCDICGKSYTQSSHLWQHLRFHQGVKPFVCQEDGCGRKFTIRPDLNDHIRKCHTGERPYHCLVCGKRFLTGSVFYQHRLIHRGERRYECEECGKRFYRADALKNHQRIHTGEKPYSCLFCTKTFRQRGDRDKHIRARHAHLDANSKLMMQMQKFQLEAAAAAAAIKAKHLQTCGGEQVAIDQPLESQTIKEVVYPINGVSGNNLPSFTNLRNSIGVPQQMVLFNESSEVDDLRQSGNNLTVMAVPNEDRNKVVVIENKTLSGFY